MTFFPWNRAFHSKRVWFSLLVILAFGLVAALAPQIALHDPYDYDLTYSRMRPIWEQGRINPAFPLGTDQAGRDIFSRLVFGARTAFALALTAVPLAALIGTLLGLVAGHTGGRVDAAILFFIDTIQSLPGIMFLIIIVLIFRSIFPPSWLQGLVTLVIGFAAISWVSLARLVRVSVMQIKSQQFVESAVSLGASPWSIIWHHLLPNVLHIILVWMINNVPAVILLEAVLGYIGVGVTSALDGGEFTVVSWGGMFFSGRSALNMNPLMLLIPSLSILLISMSFILLGDFLNETTRGAIE